MSDRPLRDHFGLFELPDKDRTWVDRSACNGSSANFFPSRMGEPGVAQALEVCHSCPVRIRCLRYALNNNIQHGIWGGYTARGRRELANALAYAENPNRIEHRTARQWMEHQLRRSTDPIADTATTLGISKATVYHHLRIDRLAKEKLGELNDPKQP